MKNIVATHPDWYINRGWITLSFRIGPNHDDRAYSLHFTFPQLAFAAAIAATVAVSRGYDTYFRKGFVMGYADCKCLSGLVEASK